MGAKKEFNHRIASFGWGLLLLWWGFVILIDPLTMGIGAIGTGLILLGLNAVRVWKRIPTVASTTTVGIITLTWGVLDQVRVFLHLSPGVSFALLVMILGGYICFKTVIPQVARIDGTSHETS